MHVFGFLVRRFSVMKKALPLILLGCLRLTIGTPAENDRLLHTLASCQ